MMASSAPSSSAGDMDPNTANLRQPATTSDAWYGVAHGCTRKLGMKICGFLQKNNSLDEKNRLVGTFKDSARNQMSCDNSERFRHTETDFSNLFARDLLPAKNGEEPTIQFLLELVDILTNYVHKTFDRSTKVLDFHHPHQLLEGMEGFNLELSDQPESLEQILVDCRDTLKYGVRTGHPRFFNQLSSGLDIIGLAGEWLTSTANTNMCGIPIKGRRSCSRRNLTEKVIILQEGILQGCNSMCAGYLFQPDKQYDVTYDTGDMAIQCGRHVDIFKFWLMWKAKGTIGFEQHIDRCLELSDYLYNKIKNREGYQMVFEGQPQHTNVCFWYIPPSLRGMPDGDERRGKLHRVAPKLKAMMMECGTTMVGYQPQGDKVNFFRMVVSNHATTMSDIDFLIDEIERLGQDL
ncbi:glutamate decarboxylase 1-like [Xyrauchen texanus]|uniref:glutamate decarboxylase 1-like n=1 Tax=Xyrauchen texanus TaxID=154827 RepID=UPI00224205A7|nr:glutamate decarboxylase 1-like [Xyrauchen texanus]